MTRVKAKPWTGSLQEEGFVRAVTAIRNRSCEVSNLYSVLRSASYPVGKTFSFVDAFTIFLSHRTTLLPNLRKYFPRHFGTPPDACGITNGWGSAGFAPKAKAIVWNGRSLPNTCPQFLEYRLVFGCAGGDALTQTMLWDEPIASQHVSHCFCLGFGFGRTIGDALAMTNLSRVPMHHTTL
jgi:hypothetical protein